LISDEAVMRYLVHRKVIFFLGVSANRL